MSVQVTNTLVRRAGGKSSDGRTAARAEVTGQQLLLPFTTWKSEGRENISPRKAEAHVPAADVPNEELQSNSPATTLLPTQNQRATEGAWTVARRRWQEGTVYLRRSKTLPDAWWGRFVESVEAETVTVRIHRNVRLGDARQFTKPLAKRALRE